MLTASSVTLYAQEDPVIRGLQDEIERAKNQLKLEDNDPPYFLAYLVNMEENSQIIGQYGSILKCDLERANQMFLDLRVGDYEFDNTNVLAGFFGIGMNMINLPIELDYDIIRKYAWLQIDGAYKDAVEKLAQKKAILQSLIPDDTIPDLAHAEPVINIGEMAKLQVDTTLWKERIRELSAIFLDYPQFKRSSVNLNTRTENRYVINSEGSAIRRGRHVHYMFIDAAAQDKQGLPVYMYDRIIVDDINDFPTESELTAWVREFAQKTAQLVEAEQIDNYIGPVILTPRAATQVFSTLFIDNLSNPRRPLTADNRFDSYLHSAKLVRKVGFRVLPDFLSVIDDPTIDSYKGHKLLGHYEYDDNGVPAEQISLVEDGRLRSYYMSRVPTKKMQESNGHGRLEESSIGAIQVVGKPGNVILQSEERLSIDELKNQMIEFCKSLDLEYGIIVDQLNYSGVNNPDEAAIFFSRPGQESQLQPILSAYKVSVKDGSMTPVRGMEFENINERILKDILAVGDDLDVNTIMFDRSFNNLASVVMPSILFEEMEITKSSSRSKKQPIVLNPLQRDN